MKQFIWENVRNADSVGGGFWHRVALDTFFLVCGSPWKRVEKSEGVSANIVTQAWLTTSAQVGEQVVIQASLTGHTQWLLGGLNLWPLCLWRFCSSFKREKSKLKWNLYYYYYCKVCSNKPTQFFLKWKLRNQYRINQAWNFWFEFKPLKCEDLLLFFILYVCKVNVWGFLIKCQTKQPTWRCFFSEWNDKNDTFIKMDVDASLLMASCLFIFRAATLVAYLNSCLIHKRSESEEKCGSDDVLKCLVLTTTQRCLV